MLKLLHNGDIVGGSVQIRDVWTQNYRATALTKDLWQRWDCVNLFDSRCQVSTP
jgi:hypothetical protein